MSTDDEEAPQPSEPSVDDTNANAAARPRPTLPVLALIGTLSIIDGTAALILLPGASGWFVAVLGAGLVALASVYSVPTFADVPARWSVSGFLHLFFTIAIGPAAIFILPMGHLLGSNLRERRGWVKGTFNLTNWTTSNLAMWIAFRAVTNGRALNIEMILVAACVATIVQLVLGNLLLTLVRCAAEGTVDLGEAARSTLASLLYHLAFGLAAGGALLLYQHWGLLGFATTLAPIAGIQATLIGERNVQHKRNEERAAYQKERELLLQHALDAQEQERDRIAADLHDGVIQELVALFYTSDGIQHHLDAPDRIKSYADQVSTVSRKAVRDLRELMTDLAPPRLEQDGLERTLGIDLEATERRGIKVHLSCRGTDQLPVRAMRLIHRVVMEATRNTTKHAKCTNLWVTVTVEPDGALACIRDDGKGFTAEEREAIQAQGHNGLGLLEKTVAAGGGSLEIASTPGRGTELRLRMPILV
jgi:signal transduction histidine kinase